MPEPIIILGIESSCDDTAAAVLVDGEVRSNIVAGQDVHRHWGGVVPELASRAHQEHIVPVVHEALRTADVSKEQLSGVAVTQGPGLIGALLVGAGFARSLAQGLDIPLLGVDHMQAHVLAHFIRDGQAHSPPSFPFLNLTVSGGHTLIVLVRGELDMEVVGTTMDDAAGEAFDKGAKVLGLPYPGGPMIDMHSRDGDPYRFRLPAPRLMGFDMSFSGVKTAFNGIVRKGVSQDPAFVERELPHLCASLQQCIIDILLRKLHKAGRTMGITRIAISGGVSANTALRAQVADLAQREGWTIHIPPLAFCTDNGAMVAMAGFSLFKAGRFAALDSVPHPR
ncbi:MAG: tRNA (adenosine(37)-N6)-threonylcarbamoyltransferase complex transferase subunit TsaD [Flavobacteriales bacterium]|nr:tRNA (adenosine(37)-N6)-threonylcarbamoyltransferase complex transferase subunit TsaD [Flavobacteriales bacterium]